MDFNSILNEFNSWLNEARTNNDISEPTAMTLATILNGKPQARVVLLKDASEAGFTFFTNYESLKGIAIAQNQSAALCFYWMPLKKQIRVEGTVSKTDAKTSDEYFATRSRDSQIGAHASAQSQPLESYEALIKRAAELKEEFAGHEVPRPAHWGGYILKPRRIEFWVEGAHRLHNRYHYILENGNWIKQQLNP